MSASSTTGRSLSPAKARRRKRLALVVGGLLALGGATALVLTAFQDSLVFFYSPTELIAKSPSPDRRVRIGGLVEAGSLQKTGQDIRFRITDTARSIDVTYRGLLPDLFREGQGVVAQGSLMPDGSFRANEVLAKHDETYMPPEVAEALKKSGRWKEGEGTTPSSGEGSAAPGPLTPGPENSSQGVAP